MYRRSCNLVKCGVICAHLAWLAHGLADGRAVGARVPLIVVAQPQLLNQICQGDFARQARLASLLTTCMMSCSLFLNPLFAAISDAFGRKPLLHFPSGADLFQRVALLPTIWGCGGCSSREPAQTASDCSLHDFAMD